MKRNPKVCSAGYTGLANLVTTLEPINLWSMCRIFGMFQNFKQDLPK